MHSSFMHQLIIDKRYIASLNGGRGTAMHHYSFSQSKPAFIFLTYLVVAAIFLILAGFTVSIVPGNSSTTQCQSNCTFVPGVHGVQLFVEPHAGDQVITIA